MNKKFYITTPIYYVNARPHIGHAYTSIAADVLARYHKIINDKVFFLTGTDEHGAKIEQAAQKKNKSVKEFCDENAENFKKTAKALNVNYDKFIRTTDKEHEEAVKKALNVLYEKGFIYKGEYEGLYCVDCEQYKSKNDLVNGKCADHQKEPELMKEESYFFKLSSFENEIKEKIESDEFEIKPEERKNEVLSFLKGGLQDISISRKNVKWGISLPFDNKFTAYVWVDAFLNYLTGIKWNGEPKKVLEFWPPSVQLMSKDILRVHATIWPAMLLALEISLPKKLFIHGYFTIDGQKMSKSLGNVIWPEDLIEKFGVDATRYLLLSACVFGKDGDISLDKLKEKYNADLAGGIGNLVSRVRAMAEKKQILSHEQISNSNLQIELDKTWKIWKDSLDEFKFNECLNSIWKLISFCDKYIEKERPWERPDKEQTIIISDLLLVINNIAQLLKPFLPETSEKILSKEKKILFPKID
ncbi:MAG TPA: methionine--tRNA ligase [bacterium]|nr:methionine--tRNA ligase [bacterium]